MLNKSASLIFRWITNPAELFREPNNCASCVAGIEENIDSNFIIYPNPTSGSVTIHSLEKSDKTPYEVYDQFGRKLLSEILSGTQSTIQLPFGSGLYYLKIGDEVVKVVIQK